MVRCPCSGSGEDQRLSGRTKVLTALIDTLIRFAFSLYTWNELKALMRYRLYRFCETRRRLGHRKQLVARHWGISVQGIDAMQYAIDDVRLNDGGVFARHILLSLQRAGDEGMTLEDLTMEYIFHKRPWRNWCPTAMW